LQTFADKDGKIIHETTSSTKILITIIATFLASFGSYALLKVLFDFGGGMLVDN